MYLHANLLFVIEFYLLIDAHMSGSIGWMFGLWYTSWYGML